MANVKVFGETNGQSNRQTEKRTMVGWLYWGLTPL